jgi:phenylpyruvate tautomerase PptA (4-oxalocrotonate tautomerase family)
VGVALQRNDLKAKEKLDEKYCFPTTDHRRGHLRAPQTKHQLSGVLFGIPSTHNQHIGDYDMPIIRVTYPEKALTTQQKDKLAPLLIDAVMRQEVDPVTEAARDATFIVFSEIPQKDCYVSKDPFWLVEGMTAAGFFTQKRRDAAHTAVNKAFVDVLGDDGSSIEWEGVRIAPKFLKRLYFLLIEIPEGSWGLGGRQTSALEIGHIIGSDKDPARWSELKVNVAKLQASRPS